MDLNGINGKPFKMERICSQILINAKFDLVESDFILFAIN